MSYTDIFLLAIALSIDAFVVSFSYGLCIEKRKLTNSLLLALTTGLFQGIMPIFGYIFTDAVKVYVQPYSKITVFIIFSYLGINFIIEAFSKKQKYNQVNICLKSLFLVGIATSIDALSSGISLSLTNSPIIVASILIGVVTFINSNFGYWLGNFLRNFKAKYFEIIGGLILIILAIKQVIPSI